MDGTLVKRAEMPPGFVGGPMVVALRPALHGALLDAVGNGPLSLGARVTGVTSTGTQVSVALADGSTVGGDLLIGADGVGSVVRRILHPTEGPPRHSGIVAVRGAAHDALHHLGDLHAVYYMGRGVESMFVRASDTGIYWFLSMARTVAPAGNDPASIIRAMAPRFDATFRAITSATDDMRFDELFDRDPLPWWGSGPITLLGDAAHPLLPHTGQGAAQAIVDAVTLGKTLGTGANIETSLRSYERTRAPKTDALVGQGRRTAWLMATTNPLVCGVRELVLRAIPVSTFARFFVRINRRAGTDIRYQ
jgi:2-polyprenyl-6-methoxyphenol hydroxylase-like FAD-dependent oxidoreductase